MFRLRPVGALAAGAVIAFSGCGGEQPTQSDTPDIDANLVREMVLRALGDSPIDASFVIEDIEGGSTGFGTGSGSSSTFNGVGDTSSDFDSGAGTTDDFGDGAGTSETIGGGFPFAFNFTNRFELRPYSAFMSNPYAGGLPVFSPGSTNQISWPSLGGSSYEFTSFWLEFDRTGYIGDSGFSSSTVAGTSYEFAAPSTSKLIVVVFWVYPTGGSYDPTNVAWGIGFVAEPGAFR